MAKISFTDEVSPASRGEVYPKLKLKLNEKARILLLEGPERVYVHELKEPTITDGVAIKEEKKRRDGSTYVDYKESFVQSFQCLGDEEVVFQSGVDVENCPACKASVKFDRFRAPTARYVLNVVKYNTRPGGTDVTEPFGVTVLTWAFGNQKFEQIRNFAKEGYDFAKHDMILGPCQNEGFQKYDIIMSQKAAYLDSETNKKLVMDTFRAQRIDPLAKVAAKEIDFNMVQTYIDRVQKKWDIVNGTGQVAAESVLASATEPSLPNIDFQSPSTALPQESSTSNFDDLLSDLNL